MDATVHPYRLKFKRPWISARSHLGYREGWLLALHGPPGVVGWGDCAPLPEAGTESAAVSEQLLKDFIPRVVGRPVGQLLDELQGLPPAARSAVETALLDLQARQEGVSLASLIDRQRRGLLKVNAACGSLDGDASVCLDEAMKTGFGLVKFKVGAGSLRQEVALLERLASQAGGQLLFRLDANGAWDLNRATEFISAVDGLPVESIEEPLAQPDGVSLQSLQERAPFPLALDESLVKLVDPDAMSSLPVKRIVLKPTVVGGPLATLAWAERARAVGAEVVITSTLESVVGVSMAAQVASALEQDMVHGLCTGEWFETDVAQPPVVRAGVMTLPSGSGLGIDVDV
ncbi:MAG: o-succinylbenzoate synthase [Sedimenticola sp.]